MVTLQKLKSMMVRQTVISLVSSTLHRDTLTYQSGHDMLLVVVTFPVMSFYVDVPISDVLSVLCVTFSALLWSVWFANHSMILTFIVIGQMIYYDGWKQV